MFNYKEFAKSMAEQCDKLMPKDLSDNDKKFLKDTLYEYTLIAGEALNNDKDFDFTDDNKIFITQIVSEWTFHKIVDLARSGIPKGHWLMTLQKIAFTVFEVAKQGCIKKISEEELLSAIEYHVVKVYKEEVLELYKKKIISDEIKENALKQSNLDTMAEETKSNEIANEYSCNIDNTNKAPVDGIVLELGSDALFIEKLKSLLPVYTQTITNELGYIIPDIKVTCSSKLDESEYAIYIKNNLVDTGNVYQSRYMIIADELNSLDVQIPDNTIISVDPIYKIEAYWVDSTFEQKVAENVTTVAPDDVIFAHLEKVLIKNVDSVIEESDIPKYIDAAKSKGFILSDKLLEKLEYNDIKDVFANLIREDISIKDITFVLSKLENYSRYHKEPDILSEMIRKDLSRQISFANCEEDKTLYAINLSSELTHKLLENIEFQHDYNKTVLNMDKDDEQKLVENVATKLMEGRMKTNVQPVLICNEKLRLALYRLLVNKITSVVVLAENEIVPAIEVKYMDTI